MVQFFGESPRMPLEHEIGLYELSDPILSSAQGLHGSREDAPTIPRFPEKLVAPRACPRIAWERRVTILTDWRVSSSRPRSARSQRQGSSTRSNHGRFLFPAGVLADPTVAVLFVPSGGSLIMRLASSSPRRRYARLRGAARRTSGRPLQSCKCPAYGVTIRRAAIFYHPPPRVCTLPYTTTGIRGKGGDYFFARYVPKRTYQKQVWR